MDIKTQSQIFKDIITESSIISKIDEGGLISISDIEKAIAEALDTYKYPSILSNYNKGILNADLNEYNKLINALYLNFATMLYSINDIANKSEISKDKIAGEIRLINKKIRELEYRINTIKMKNKYYTGELYTFYEPFVTSEHIDKINTNAVVDLEANLVRASYSGSKLINIFDTDIDQITSLPNWNSDYISASYISNSNLNGILTNTGFIVYQIKTTRPINEAQLTIKIKLKNNIITNSIEIYANKHSVSSEQHIKIFTSVDDVNYESINTQFKPVGNKIIFTFKEKNIKFIKLLFSKTAPDTITLGESIYYFTIDNIKFYSNSVIKSSTFMSTAITLPENKPFDSASLEVCETTPNDSSIKYFIGASQSNMLEIMPVNKTIELNSTASIFNSKNTEYIEKFITKDNNASNYYLFTGTTDTFLNDINEDNIIYDSLIIYKNGNSKTLSTDLQNETMSNGIIRGWEKIDDHTVSCIFYVDVIEAVLPLDTIITKEDGTYRPIFAIIDGKMHIEKVVVNKGFHKIFISINDYDKLHKILLSKVKFIAEGKLTRVQPGAVSQYDSHANIWSLIKIKDHNSIKNKIIIKNFSGDNLYFIVTGRKEMDDALNKIYIKALLNPSSSGESPILHGYSVKFNTISDSE